MGNQKYLVGLSADTEKTAKTASGLAIDFGAREVEVGIDA
jgi:transketolase C-terminal domain/subunit